MFKYYDVLDKHNSVKIYDPKQSDFRQVQYELPIEFFNKYSVLFNELQTVFTTYSLLTEDTIRDRLKGLMSSKNISEVVHSHNYISLRRHEPYDGVYRYVDDFYRLEHPTNYICENYLADMLNIIRNLMIIYPHNKPYYEFLLNKTEAVYSELRKTNCIVSTEEYKTFKIPNAWYLTSNGTLYNSMGEKGHYQSNLIYPLYDVLYKSIDNKELKNERDKHLELYNQIKENGYLSIDDYVKFLNWSGDYDTFIDDRIYHQAIVDIVLGIVRAHAELFDSLDKLNETDNFDESLKKVLELTDNHIDDLLIRFCGMSKVKASGLSFICTADTYENRTIRKVLNR